ncbi:MAG: HAD-IIIA family hydrolase [Planctomycetes bacterium]|nr:HAD-IIIA family hydrolase [Planctomycetota bacterium]
MGIEDIKLISLDMDGVLSDGRIVVTDQGWEMKEFDVHDGHGIRMLYRAGLQAAIISGRESKAVAIRARDLGIEHCYLGIHNKIEALTEILAKVNLREDEVCVVGDDLPDMPIMRRCGYPVAVANARPEVKAIAAYVTTAHGGRGAVREVIEMVLKTQGKWDGVMARYRE